MGQKSEQIGKTHFRMPRKMKRAVKHQTVKKRRRIAKRNTEATPKQNRYDGWWW
jgi:hypothetical protein